jgi:uncharacterized protein (TIGR03083 family)
MMTTSSDAAEAHAPVRPRLGHREAMQLAATEYERMVDALAALTASDWTRPTDCPAWDVRQMGCHMVGMAEMASSPAETKRQQQQAAADAAARGVDHLSALTSLQVVERASWTPTDVVDGARRVAPRAARGRRLTPVSTLEGLLPTPQIVGQHTERWTIGFLVEVVLTRDPWMHRMDLARATGRAPFLTAEHDGAIVADVVAEWAERHGAPYELALTGPAGGRWSRGSGGERIEMDAVDFCRVLSGRGQAPGLLSVAVPF